MRYKLLLIALCCAITASAQGIRHSVIGTTVKADDGSLTITSVDKRQNFAGGPTHEPDINSPKSVNIHPNGKKYYVNSLEGCCTVVFEMGTNKKLKTIRHHFDGSEKELWSTPSSLYPFTHYTHDLNRFDGKPVEGCFTHGGRYFWVPYYRRSYDINAQDPSALAVIDTQTDDIILLMETGPLPKMIAASHDGKYVAVTHWGNNTVGLIRVDSANPRDWHHEEVLVVDYVLPLNFSLRGAVNRDVNSGYCLRGTVFTPDDKYLLVGCMGGAGGIAVIDVQARKYLGRMLGMRGNVRHLVIKDGLLYLSINNAGYVQRMPLEKFLDAARAISSKTGIVSGWQECAVGGGARTIEISPSGKFVFAACNSASGVYVVNTKTMKTIAHIACDSYPVGLDLSRDGKYVIVTSQGKRGGGGNAVNIYSVEYAEPEPVAAAPEMPATATDSVAADSTITDSKVTVVEGIDSKWLYIGGGALMLLILLALIMRRRKK